MNDATPAVIDGVEVQCRSTPTATAVVDDEGTLTYAQLWSLAGLYAGRLSALGVRAGANVAIAAHRSASFVVGVLAILRVGAAYVPLDPAYPVPRLRLMVELAGVRVLLNEPDSALHAEEIGVAQTLILDGRWPVASAVPPPRSATGDCYVMFTSGSTGVPKGVVHQQSSLANLLAWQARESLCGPGSRTALFASTSFDVSFQEIFATLGSGGVLVCVSQDVRNDMDLLWSVLVRQQVQRLFVPAVALQLLAEFAPDNLAEVALKEIITAGEQLVVTPRLRWMFSRLGDCRLANQYGPTETHVVTQFILPADPHSWPTLPPIGTPIDGVRIQLLDGALHEVAPGEVGEIAISGVALSKGYLHRPDENLKRFVVLPGPGGATRVYLTGDLGRLGDDGQLYFAGRIDDQVKIQGYRVECGEVEAALLSLPDVRSCLVVPVGEVAMERELEASVVVLAAVDAVALRRQLEQLVPHYMVPARIHIVSSLPVTYSGKVNRRREPTAKVEPRL